MDKEIKEIIPEIGDPIPKNWIEKAQAELKSDHRIIELDFRGSERKVYIYRPSVQDDEKASFAYSKSFNRFLNDSDFKTEQEMEDMLRERGIWGEKEEKRIEEIRDSMTATAVDICSIKDNQKAKDRVGSLRNQWLKLRDEMNALSTKRHKFMVNTVESLADHEKIKVKLYLCVKFEDGAPVWKTKEELETEKDQRAVSKITHEAILFWSGLNTEIIDRLPDYIFNMIGEGAKSEN